MLTSKTILRAFFALGLAIAAVVPSGCARKDIDLEFWHIQVYDPTRPVLDAAVKRYEARSGLTVEVVPIANDAFKTKLKVALAARDMPDIFHTWGGGVLKSAIAAGAVVDMTDMVPESVRQRFHPAAASFVTHKGRLYAVPADVSLVVMWYNREIFAEHGLETPKTFAELISVCKTLKRKDVVPIALGNLDRWPGCFYFCYLATRIGGTGPLRAAAEGTPGGTFEHPCFVEAGHKLRQLVEADAFPRGFNGLNATEARNLFFTGKAAMMLMGTWTLAHAATEAPEGFIEQMGCFPFPTVKGGSGSARTVLGGVNAAYAVSAGSTNQKAAVNLALELVSDATSRAWAATGRIPALTREAAEPMLPKRSLSAARILFDADEIQLYYDQYLNLDLAEEHKDTTQGIFLNNLTPEAAAAKMQTRARELAAQSH